MKVLDKIALVLFSSIVLIISILFCFVIFGWINIDVMTLYIKQGLQDPIISNITLGILVLFILLAIKGIFYTTNIKKENGTENGILIQSENGKLFISKDTINNIVSGVVKQVEGAKDISSKVLLTKEGTISIDVSLYVSQEVIIKDLSNELQQKIRETIKKSIDIDIQAVNISIKNITRRGCKKRNRRIKRNDKNGQF